MMAGLRSVKSTDGREANFYNMCSLGSDTLSLKKKGVIAGWLWERKTFLPAHLGELTGNNSSISRH